MADQQLLLLGAGGHASVIADILLGQKRKIVGIISPRVNEGRAVFAGLNQLSQDDEVLRFGLDEVRLVNGIGVLPGQVARHEVYGRFSGMGYRFESIIASTAVVSPYAQLGEGVQILHGAIIQAGAVIGDNSIVNSGVIIEHDCIIGSHNHIAPGVTLSGGVKTGTRVHIGTQACVIQSLVIGSFSVIGAGAVITKSVPDNHTVYPARGIVVENFI